MGKEEGALLLLRRTMYIAENAGLEAAKEDDRTQGPADAIPLLAVAGDVHGLLLEVSVAPHAASSKHCFNCAYIRCPTS
jgi:hypothetical protein